MSESLLWEGQGSRFYNYWRGRGEYFTIVGRTGVHISNCAKVFEKMEDNCNKTIRANIFLKNGTHS